MLQVTGTLVPVVNFFESCTTTGWTKILRRPIPYKWNPVEKRFEVEPSFQQKWWLLSISVPSVVGVLLAIHALLKKEPFQIPEFQAFLRFFGGYCLFGTNSALFLKSNSGEFVWMLNSILKFEEQHHHVHHHRSKHERVVRVLRRKGRNAARVLITFRRIVLASLVPTSISAIKHPTWASNPFCVFTNFHQGNYYEIFNKLFQSSKLVKGLACLAISQVWRTPMVYWQTTILIHIILVNFWFRSMLLLLEAKAEEDDEFETMPGSGFLRRRSQVKMQSSLLSAHRQVQLLINRYNASHKGNIIPGFLAFFMSMNISSSYILIRNGHNSGASVVLSLAAVVVVTGIALASSVMHPSSVHNLGRRRDLWSKGYVAKEINKRNNNNINNIQWVRRFWRSFPKMKIEYLFDSYFDGTSPISVLAFCFNCVLNLCLLRL